MLIVSTRLVSFVLTILFFMIIGVGPSLAQQKPFQAMIITTASSGGSFYIIGSTLGRMIEDATGIRVSPQVSAGSAENARLVAGKKAELGGCSEETLLDAYQGKGVYKKEKLDNLRAMISLYSFDLVVCTTPKSPYDTFASLKGRRLGVGPPGSATMIASQFLVEGYGMTFKDFNTFPFGFNEMYDALGDGHLDALITVSAHPSAGLQNVSTMHGLKFVKLDDKVIEKVCKTNPQFYKATITPGAAGGPYKEIKEPYSTLGTPYILITHKDMDEKLVYTMTKTILENITKYEKAHPQMKDIRFATALNGLAVPLHPGAERYYREKKHPLLK